MPSPERKAAGRITAALNEARKSVDRATIPMVAIIAEEFAPMRALMERMVEFVPLFAEGAEVLSDYAKMKAGWEAENVSLDN